jgi:hypothetical protein
MGLIKKIIFITTFIAVFGWLLGGNIQTTKAQTMEELSAQITVLRNQIAEYQKNFNKDNCVTAIDQSFLQKYYGKKTTEITQCKAVVVPGIPETEYKCPDVNGNGTVDLTDLTILSKAFGSCQGDANYNAQANFDKDNCVTTTDQAFLQKYYGKKTTEITQCKAVSALDIESMMASIADAISKIAEEVGKLIR